MQEKDAVTNEYLHDPERVADMMNGFIFKGQQILDAENVKELGERIYFTDEPQTETEDEEIEM